MAGKKKVTITRVEETPEAGEGASESQEQNKPPQFIPDDEPLADPDLDTLLAEIGPQTKKVSLYRQDDKSPTKWHYLTKTDVSLFTMEAVKEEFGGGNYKARFIDERGVYITQFLFSIDPRFRPTLSSSPSLSSIPSGQTEGLGELKEILRQQTALIAELTKRKDVDPLAGMEKLVAIISPLIKREDASIPASSSFGFKEAFDIFKQGMDMGQMVNGDSYLPVVEKMGMPLLNMLGELVKNGKGVQEKINKAIPTKAPVSQETPSPAPQGQPTTLEGYLQFYIPQLIQLAKADKDPSLYADFVLDQIPENFLDQLYQLLQQPNLIEQLVTLQPEIKNHEQWFKDFIQRGVEALSPESDNEAASPASSEEEHED